MIRRSLSVLLVSVLLFSGCSALPATPSTTDMPSGESATVPVEGVTQTIDSPADTGTAEVEEAPPPQINLPVVGVGDPYPAPANEEIGSGIEPPAEPTTEEESGSGMLTQADLSITNVEVRVENGNPTKVSLVITGNLPTPCHQFAYTLGQPDSTGSINIDVFSLVDPDQICTQNIQPFEQVIDLGSFPSGQYTILVNGEVVQELDL